MIVSVCGRESERVTDDWITIKLGFQYSKSKNSLCALLYVHQSKYPETTATTFTNTTTGSTRARQNFLQQ